MAGSDGTDYPLNGGVRVTCLAADEVTRGSGRLRHSFSFRHHLELAHHLVVLVLEHMAMDRISPSKAVELGDHAGDLKGIPEPYMKWCGLKPAAGICFISVSVAG